MKIGAYAVERDYSHYVSSAAKTVLAVVGTASKGPIGVATVVTSTQDLVNKFGTLRTDCYALYAAQYFLSQSSKMYFVRAASTSAAESSLVIKGLDVAEDIVDDALSIKMLEKGTYFDDYTLTVTEGVEDKEGKYTLVLKNSADYTVEIIKDIDLDDLSVGYKSSHMEVSAFNSETVSLTPGTYVFAGGNNGIDDIESGDYVTAGNALAADTVDMNLLAVPGVSDVEVITAMMTLTTNRGDALYVVDCPQGLTRDGVIEWHNGGGNYDHTVLNCNHAALYYDWLVIYDSVNKTRVVVPPSVAVVATIAYSDRISEVWFAPAGLKRGIITGVLDSVTKLNKTDIELLYSDDNNINCIYDDPQVGLVLWGQKTLCRTGTALDRINVRRLLNYLKRVVVAACNYLTFDPNDRITWNSFEMKVKPVLESVKKRRGMYEYRIIKGEMIVTDDDIDNYRMPCMIMIRPTKAAEEIPIYFTITSTGADFNEVLEANGIVSL